MDLLFQENTTVYAYTEFGKTFVVWFGRRVSVQNRESLRAKTELYLENEAFPSGGFFFSLREGIDLKAHQFSASNSTSRLLAPKSCLVLVCQTLRLVTYWGKWDHEGPCAGKQKLGTRPLFSGLPQRS